MEISDKLGGIEHSQAMNLRHQSLIKIAYKLGISKDFNKLYDGLHYEFTRAYEGKPLWYYQSKTNKHAEEYLQKYIKEMK